MKRIVCLTILLLFSIGWGMAMAAGNPIIIWRWVDVSGKVHYTDNYNSIPDDHRASAVQGVFRPEKPITTNPGNNTNSNNPNKVKHTNTLNIYDAQFTQKGDLLVVSGRVVNGFARPQNNVKIKVTFYDSKDNFIRSEVTFVQPISLKSGEQGNFKVEIPFSENIRYYKIEPILE